MDLKRGCRKNKILRKISYTDESSRNVSAPEFYDSAEPRADRIAMRIEAAINESGINDENSVNLNNLLNSDRTVKLSQQFYGDQGSCCCSGCDEAIEISFVGQRIGRHELHCSKDHAWCIFWGLLDMRINVTRHMVYRCRQGMCQVCRELIDASNFDIFSTILISAVTNCC